MKAPPSAAILWRRNLVVWITLVVLLTTTVHAAYLPLGSLNGPIAILIAALKAVLVAVFFMSLNRSNALIRLIAIMGLVFVAILFSLTAMDVLTRI